MNYLSVCSGVEAASQAWEPLGWKPVAFSEIEPFPCAVLASRFPNVPNLGDMSKIHYNRNTKELTNGTDVVVCRDGIDLLVGGTPCQSFSVAGKRAGLEGASGLAYHYARLIGEIQPRWFVWENVPGALSSVTYGDQRDFNFLLQQFSIGGDADLGVRYECCWRVLDTQYVRVESYPRAIPQRRRRVFIVGHLATDCGGGCEVLLEPEGVRGNPAPCRVKGQGVAGDFEKGAGGADGEKRIAFNWFVGKKNPAEGVEISPTLQVSDMHCPAVTESYGINPQNGSLMVPCTKEVGQTNAVGHENGVAIAYAGYNQTAHDECTYPLRTANGSEGDDRTVKVAIRTANGVECLTPSADHPQTHRVYGTNGAYLTMMAKAEKSGADQSAILTMDGANEKAVAYPVAMRGNRTKDDRGKFPETDMGGAAYSLTSVQTDSMVAQAVDGGGYAPLANNQRGGCDADA